MSEISAAQVKELRDKTGAGMMDCKRALMESAGDLESAVDWLRKKGLAAAAKKSGRVTADGLIGAAVAERAGALVEVNTETDFVSRNPDFRTYVAAVTRLALTAGGDLDALKRAPYPETGRTVQEQLTFLISTMGENMNLRRTAALSVAAGVVAPYVHSAQAPGLGKIGVLVALDSTADPEALQPLGKQLAMHVAAAAPRFVSSRDVDSASLDRERAILMEQAQGSGKPAAIIEKMVEGRLRRFYEEVCLLDQIFVIDGESRVSAVIDKAAKDLGAPIAVAGFLRYALGEGIDKQGKDFATEVAEAVKG
jgi:elongation factor Ts